MLFTGTLDPLADEATLFAIDTASGEIRWETIMEDALHIYARLWEANGVVIVPTLDGELMAFDAATGAERWHYQPGAARLGNVTVAGDTVWMMLVNGHLVAVNTVNGEEVARVTDIELDLTTASYAQRPGILGNHIIMPVGVSLFGYALEQPETEQPAGEEP
jgi:outer membrane protein assembly factor BamB